MMWGAGRCTFAVNRRENKEAEVPQLRESQQPLKGPNDHDVPVLACDDNQVFQQHIRPILLRWRRWRCCGGR